MDQTIVRPDKLMSYTRQTLIQALTNYTTRFEEEKNFASDFLKLLQHERAFHRDHLPGHITGSAWIIDAARTSVLLTHHAKLDNYTGTKGFSGTFTLRHPFYVRG